LFGVCNTTDIPVSCTYCLAKAVDREGVMLERQNTVCRRCNKWMRLRSVEDVSSPEKLCFVNVYECRECGRLAAEDMPMEPALAAGA
jgi:hypothetical protein